jgi:glycosyltransferase involved in cell wall biosynthesis
MLPAHRRPFGVNLAGYFQSEKGMGEGIRALRRAFDAGGVPLAPLNIIDDTSANVEGVGPCSADNPLAVNLLFVNADAVELNAGRLGLDWFLGHYNVGHWSWELAGFPDFWDASFRWFDEVWTPSRFARDAIAKRSPVPVRAVHYPITVPAEEPGLSRATFGLPAGAFLFLFAFDFQSFLERKNPLAAVRAFRQAFGDRDDVLLLLKSVHAADAPEAAARLREACAGCRNVRLFDAVLSRAEMSGLMRLCDCFVSLHRAEGFGLHLAEAMALGKPVVATNYSANTEYMTPECSLLVNFRLVPLDQDFGPYRRGQVWADAETDHAAALMRGVAGDREFARRLGAAARAHVTRQLSLNAIGAEVHALVKALGDNPPRTDGLVQVALERESPSRLARLWWRLTDARLGRPPAALLRAGAAVGRAARLWRRAS